MTKQQRTITNRNALNSIAEILRDPEWSSGMLEDIAEIVAWTGRDLETETDEDGEPIETWARH